MMLKGTFNSRSSSWFTDHRKWCAYTIRNCARKSYTVSPWQSRLSWNTKDGSTLHATSHASIQYPDDNSTSTSSVSVPLEKRHRKTVAKSESMTVTETDVSLKDRRDARSVSGVPLASQQGQPTSVIADEHFVWTLIRLLVSRNDGDATAPTWEEFYEILSGNEAPKPRTVIGYGPLFPVSYRSGCCSGILGLLHASHKKVGTRYHCCCTW